MKLCCVAHLYVLIIYSAFNSPAYNSPTTFIATTKYRHSIYKENILSIKTHFSPGFAKGNGC